MLTNPMSKPTFINLETMAMSSSDNKFNTFPFASGIYSEESKNASLRESQKGQGVRTGL